VNPSLSEALTVKLSLEKEPEKLAGNEIN